MTSISVLLLLLLLVSQLSVAISPTEAATAGTQSAGFALRRRPIPPLSVSSSANHIAYRDDPKVTVARSIMDVFAAAPVNVYVNITVNGKEKGTFVIKCSPDMDLGDVLEQIWGPPSEIVKDLDTWAFMYKGTKLPVSDTVAEVLENTGGKDAATAITLDVTKAPTKAAIYGFRVGKQVTSALGFILFRSLWEIFKRLVLKWRIRRSSPKKQQKQDSAYKAKREAALPRIVRRRHRVLSRSAEYKTSGWLTTLPSTDNNAGLDSAEFRDALNMRHGRHPPGLTARCDHSNQPLTADHAMCCKRYGLVIRRHNELWDTFAELIGMAWGDAGVRREVVLKEGEEGNGGVRADLVARQAAPSV
ncbi:unnamed protein product [Vitrella brassicaformis CCMP3155]|uniref:Ubiquitin-like domain-containing protein n=1 Tax=Vitrella brassicaformis (strain CCMP3155) TaxID=1169540 RepID=A0A0G4G207_VITBC|nr:unnamed protein product [Vitrella brassicaformis CCMP3155]|eukprot:CEM21772.1 unnamed protein product [Vitrella brassicaformis CCMP3155]